jgi:hypothetical protein
MGEGSLLQLVAQGKQDVFLSGNPQMTWYKAVYRRHTNFAIESQRMPFDNQADFGRRVSCLVPRKGDLLGPLFLRIQLPGLTLPDSTPASYVNAIGHALIQEISLEIGEQEVDKQTGEWMEIYSNFTTTADQKYAFYNMIGKVDGYTSPDPTLRGPLTLYVPLRFWFCRNPGLYLPLLAMQFHPVRINITFRPLQDLFYSNTLINCTTTQVNQANMVNCELWGDYVFLDTEEKRRFVSTHHEYLIEQVQYTPSEPIPQTATQIQVPMEFNHPIKELFWVIQRDFMTTQHEWFNYSSLALNNEAGARTDILASAVLRLDGMDRFDERDAMYFRLVQPYQRHSVIPYDFIYNYSFALQPEQYQPSGTLNASRIDNLTLQITMNTAVTPQRPSTGSATCRVYAVNYNVLRVIDGFAGLLFRV